MENEENCVRDEKNNKNCLAFLMRILFYGSMTIFLSTAALLCALLRFMGISLYAFINIHTHFFNHMVLSEHLETLFELYIALFMIENDS